MWEKVKRLFPSPHSGILFLFCIKKKWMAIRRNSFRPLIRGFFFYLKNIEIICQYPDWVSVPSFGDSFFISYAL